MANLKASGWPAGAAFFVGWGAPAPTWDPPTLSAKAVTATAPARARRERFLLGIRQANKPRGRSCSHGPAWTRAAGMATSPHRDEP